MAYDLEEQEKIDALKAWWERYGTFSMVLVLAVVAAFAGWRGWQWYSSHQAGQAMGYYEALETAAGQQGDDAVARIKAASAALRKDYAGSGYASRGVLVAAWALQERQDLDGAREQLEWLVRDGSAQPASPTISAGTPATVTLCGTGFSTTEPAAMRAQCPISILPRIFAPALIRTPRRIFGCRSPFSLPVPPSVTPCRIETSSSITAVSPTTKPVA